MSKYIDAEKLVAKIEGRIEEYNASIEENYNNIKAGIDAWRWAECKWFLSLIDSLQHEQPDFADASKMEQPSVEEAMKALNEKIALVKESGTWDGVDVDKYMDDVRGREPEVDLEKEIQDWNKEKVTGVKPIYTADSLTYSLLPETARHFYELGRLNARKEG